ncbi:MAG: hypothetical protein WBG50_18415 [Desulfomonilaceae bacterium]
MHRHKVWLLAMVLCLSVIMFKAPAGAWEFIMDGAFTWEFDYRSQGGGQGFFGPYDQDAGSGIPGTVAGFYAPINGWLGEQAGNFASGSDSSWQTEYMSTDMELRINPAIRIDGNYYIGSWGETLNPNTTPNVDFGQGNLVAAENANSKFQGVQRSFSPGYWNTLWADVQLPWGLVRIGKRPSIFGIGMFYNGLESRSTHKISLEVPYGPFLFGLRVDTSRRSTTTVNFGGTPPNPNIQVVGTSRPSGYFNQDFDKNNKRQFDFSFPVVRYHNGPLETGILWNPVRWLVGGEGIIASPGTRVLRPFVDHYEQYGVWYLKYNNGRFFLNTELDWDHQINRNRRKLASGAPDFGHFPGARDTYIENWRAVAEGGFLCGPAMLSVIYAWSSGPDRRGGAQIDRTGLLFQAGRTSTSTIGSFTNVRPSCSNSNTGLFRPYSLLMVYSYGLGTHINGDTGNGYVEDASVYGARLDYAVASNLNTYLSFFWADRVSKSGYGWGFIKPVVPNGTINPSYTAPAINFTGFAAGTATTSGLPSGTVALYHDVAREGAPSIPDANLGWEIDAGFDWKLLEGFTVNFSSAYWQPGQWFSWACVDKAVANWAQASIVTAGFGNMNPAAWGVNPNRQIDPIFGIELRVVGSF